MYLKRQTHRRGGQAQNRAIFNVIAILWRITKIKAEFSVHWRHVCTLDTAAWS